MKVLHINSIAGGSDGVSLLIDAVSGKLKDGGNECYVGVSQGECKVSGVRNFHIGNSFDRKKHKLITQLTDAHGFQSVRATGGLIDHIMELRPDIVHLHNLHGYYLHVGLLMDFLKRSQLPVVLTMHDHWTMTGHCINPTVVNCNKFVDGRCNKCPLLKSYPSTWRDNTRRNIREKRKVFIDATNLFLVAQSGEMAETLHKSWMGNHPIFVIPTDNELDKSGNFAETTLRDMAEAYLELYKNLI